MAEKLDSAELFSPEAAFIRTVFKFKPDLVQQQLDKKNQINTSMFDNNHDK